MDWEGRTTKFTSLPFVDESEKWNIIDKKLFHNISLKFICSEKATKFCKFFTLLLSYVVPVKSKVKISQNFVAFSEYIYEL